MPLLGNPYQARGSGAALCCLILCSPCSLPVVMVVRRALGGEGSLGVPTRPQRRSGHGPFLPIPGGCLLVLGLYSSLLGSKPASGFTLAPRFCH